MNIEIANRLVQLRKSNGLSQEALAEKLGISRQAVSKWERAEASPDTDNLITLAKLYKVSLDDLLMSSEDDGVVNAQNAGENERDAGAQNNGADSVYTNVQRDATSYMSNGAEDNEAQEYVQDDFERIHVTDKDGSEVHVGWDGIHVEETENESELYNWYERHRRFPFAVVISLLYFVLGILFNAWHPAWLLFLLIPLWYSFMEAVKKDNANAFAYPVLATLVFLGVGFFLNMWHPGWVIFLTIPVYYSLVSYLNNRED